MRQERQSSITARRAVITSTVVDVLDATVTIAMALVSGSAAVFAKGMQAFADLVSDTFLIIGIHRARRPADQMHPFGYARSIYVWTLFSALTMLILSAGGALALGVYRLLDPVELVRVPLALGVLLFSLAANGYAVFISFKRVFGGNPGSFWKVLLYSARVEGRATIQSDALGFLSSLFGFGALGIYLYTGNSFFDVLGSFVIGGLLVIAALMLIVGIKRLIIGQSIESGVRDALERSVSAVDGVSKVLDLKAISFGSEDSLVSLEVHFNDGLSTDELERCIDVIEGVVRTHLPSARHIHVEPETPTHIKGHSEDGL